MAVCLIGCKQEEPANRTSDSMLNGVFSVSATKKVRFSRGNLQYRASTDTWRFAEHQWDIVGMGFGQTYEDFYCTIGGTVTDGNNILISSSYNGWIDLFGWATSGWDNTEEDPYAVNYNPWSVIDNYVHYYNISGFGPSSNQTDQNLTGESANYDWGCNQIGEDAPRMWRTLTKDEWYYLLCTRRNADNKYGVAKVNGVTGVVILPDDWIGVPVGCNFTPGMADVGSWYDWDSVAATNVYSAEQWIKMEAAGAVFLPCAGVRYGSIPQGVGAFGSYWSTTANYDFGAYALYFDFVCFNLNGKALREEGHSVRLVSEQ